MFLKDLNCKSSQVQKKHIRRTIVDNGIEIWSRENILVHRYPRSVLHRQPDRIQTTGKSNQSGKRKSFLDPNPIINHLESVKSGNSTWLTTNWHYYRSPNLPSRIMLPAYINNSLPCGADTAPYNRVSRDPSPVPATAPNRWICGLWTRISSRLATFSVASVVPRNDSTSRALLSNSSSTSSSTRFGWSLSEPLGSGSTVQLVSHVLDPPL